MSGKPRTMANWRAAAGICLAAGVLALVWHFHGDTLYGRWRYDDPILLLYILQHPDPAGYFFSADVWRALGVPFFTPWIALEYWLDFSLFGLNPGAFYLHHLASLGLCAMLTVLLLRPHAGLPAALTAAALFVLGSPTVTVAQQLMSRHYATGLVFAVLAILLWLRALRDGGRLAPWLAAGFYLLAMLNKEVFAPLPLAILLLGNAGWKKRLLSFLPLTLAAILYVAWRTAMLGVVVGGYSGSLHAMADLPASLMSLPVLFFGPGWRSWLGGGLVLTALGLLAIRSGLNAVRILTAACALILPFTAAQVSPDPAMLRFLLVPWWAICVALALGAGTLAHAAAGRSDNTRQLVAMAALCCICVLAGTQASAVFEAYRERLQLIDAHDRFLWTHDEAVAYVPVGEMAGLLQAQYGTTALKRTLLRAGTPRPVPFAESASSLAGTLPVHGYDTGCRCLMPLERNDGAPTARLPGVLVDRTGGLLAWKIGADPGSACHLLFSDLNASFHVPCEMAILFSPPAWLQGEFRAIIRTADRWSATPPLRFPAAGDRLQWPPASRPVTP